MRTLIRSLATTLILTHTTMTWAQTQAIPDIPEPAKQDDQQLEGKVVWGTLLLKLLAPTVTEIFVKWLAGKISVKTNSTTLKRLAEGGTSAVIVDFAKMLFGTTGTKAQESVPAGAVPNATAGAPATPLAIRDGEENYQGVHVSLVGVDGQGSLTGFQPLAQGFRSGERFKLRVVSTFDALVVLENINPKGERKALYPSEQKQAVFIKAGEENLLPLENKLALQFAGTTGEDKLVITVRDPRSLTSAPATGKVFRQDHEYGSNFVQETSHGTYPVIAESVSINHHP